VLSLRKDCNSYHYLVYPVMLIILSVCLHTATSSYAGNLNVIHYITIKLLVNKIPENHYIYECYIVQELFKCIRVLK
jgi:hypothetical protein